MTESTRNTTFPSLITGIPAPRLDSIPEAFRPFAEMGMKVQSEFFHLCSCRARAWLDWPGQCISCKNLDDLTKAQRDYLVQMQQDYAQFMDAVLQDTLIEEDDYKEESESGSTVPLHREAA